ncbi:CGNR zinc finger domain-containing protein [Glaciibacter psychrotolerans]|uniref:Putative RNA-binding Zn ribbon-like protein n=1 Tax=Glaciibacter psychrotolerans TaxID=670054 RepID=A0A7Z0J7N7_9MICO|nr:CGNR zinc finger domain-containing protein [Leifsonia psychrotolerans]NYJ21501.1 putative RNA-binding Zn ribbon-like protein [Leifsonia psychrotolerans]
MTVAPPEPARTSQTGQWFDSGDGQRWWFDSGSIALDFAYSGVVGTSGSRETFHTSDDLAMWLNERFSPGVQTQERDLIDALALREAIARLAVAAAGDHEADGQDIDIVNLFAATPDIPPALSGGSRQAGRTSPRAGQALSTLARTAVDLFGPGTAGRIRFCSADDCAILYLDSSRSANRRWCSMQRCGNRAKVRAFRERTTSATTGPVTSGRHAQEGSVSV